MPRKLANGSVGKNDALTLRIEPQLKYMLELTARKQHRNLSLTTTWSIEQTLISQPGGVKSLGLGDYAKTVATLWSPYESDRLVLLATAAPHLMSFTEDLIWRFLLDDDRYWNAKEAEEGRSPNLKAIRNDWPQIRREALASVQASRFAGKR